MLHDEQCRRKQILQPAKFRNPTKFHNPAKFSQLSKIFLVLHFLLFFAIFSFWFLIYNAEFNSNSSCLDRLNNFGINSLQKLQN